MTQPEKSITIEGELTHHWWRDEGEQVSIDRRPITDAIAALPVLNTRNRMFAMSPTATPYEVEREISYGRVRVTIEVIQ